MAKITIDFFSNYLCRPVQFKMVIPNDPNTMWQRTEAIVPDHRAMKTLFLLHGYTGAGDNWVPEYLIDKYHFAVVTPSGENGFWVDGISTGHKYGSFLAIELVDYVRKTFKLAMSAEETYICGMSMGGFGALHTALMYPDRFGKVAALSSALIIHAKAHMKPGMPDSHANYEYYRECFGDLEVIESSRHNPEVLVEEILGSNQTMPEIFMCCGTEDFLLENNREFHRFLEAKKVPHVYEEAPGNHDMVFWDQYVRIFVEKMFG